MYCSNCGVLLKEDGSNFCSNCGKPISRVNSNMNQSQNAGMNQGMSYTYTQNYPYPMPTQVNNTMAIKIVAIVGCSLGILAIFFPFVNVSVFGIRIGRSFYQMAQVDFIFFLAAAIAGLVGSIKEKYSLPMLTGAIYGALLYIDTYDYFQKLEAEGSIVVKGIGFYCMVLAVVVMIVSGVIGKKMKGK